MCRPAFDVELERDVDQLLVIHCVFASPSDLPMSLDDTIHDTFCELFPHSFFICHSSGDVPHAGSGV